MCLGGFSVLDHYTKVVIVLLGEIGFGLKDKKQKTAC